MCSPLAQVVHSLLFAGGHMGYGLLVVRLFACYVLLSLSSLLRHFVPVHSFVFVVDPFCFRWLLSSRFKDVSPPEHKRGDL